MRQREIFEVGPERITGDVLDEDGLASKGRRAARTDVRFDRDSIDRAVVFDRQARPRTVPEMNAVVIQQQHGTDHPR